MAAGQEDVFHHVRDFPHYELPGPITELPLPHLGLFPLTRFMLAQVIAAVLVFFIFRGLAKRVQGGKLATGRWWNFWETLALYIRDHVVRPTIGTGHHGHNAEHHYGDAHHAAANVDDPEPAVEQDIVPGPHGMDVEVGHTGAVVVAHPADRYLPFIWSCFFYVLFCNLLGAFPWVGSATGEINVTGALAVAAFGAVLFYGVSELGFAGFWKAQAPHMDVPGMLKPPLVAMIWIIEVLGLFIKHAVLAVRLFANIMAGHTVLAVMLMFIAQSANSALFYVVTPASILGQIGIGLLELFVSFLQAYIFAFLATLFIGTAVHPH